jgi:hypothetical protein
MPNLPGGRGVEEILTEEGAWRLSLWQTLERRTKVFDGDAGGPSNTVSNPGLETTMARTFLNLTHAVTSALSVDVGINYGDIEFENDSDPTAPVEQRSEGLGDTTLVFRYAFLPGESDPHEEDGSVHAHPPLFSLNAGISFPTGDVERPEIMGTPAQPVANSTLQLGTGTFDPLVGASYAQLWGPFTSFGSVAVRIPGGENRFDYETGLAGQVNLGASVPVREGFSAVPKVAYAWQDADQLDGDDVFASGGQWIYVVPGFLLQVSEKADFQAAVEIPVWRNLRTEQLDTQARVTFGLNYRF